MEKSEYKVCKQKNCLQLLRGIKMIEINNKKKLHKHDVYINTRGCLKCKMNVLCAVSKNKRNEYLLSTVDALYNGAQIGLIYCILI